ncbi:MAG: hypothetical protein ACHQ03_09425 [Candidatus Bathyarchaeia archaeon]
MSQRSMTIELTERELKLVRADIAYAIELSSCRWDRERTGI